MRTVRLYHPPPIITNTILRLDRQYSHYVCNVLRLQNGSPMTLFDGLGHCYNARFVNCEKQGANIQVELENTSSPESRIHIHLLQGLSRGDRMDSTIQKATELGVSAITPVYTDRSAIKLTTDRAERKLEHWRSIAISACEQSGRNVLPTIGSPINFVELNKLATEDSLKIVLDPRATSNLKSLHFVNSNILVLSGPEGGFSDSELTLANQHGFQPVQLGPRILRTETAAVALLSAIQTLWGDF